MNRLDLNIKGMSCGHCVGSVRKALTELDGVTVEQVSVGSATVAYEPNAISPTDIAHAIQETGFEVLPGAAPRAV